MPMEMITNFTIAMHVAFLMLVAWSYVVNMAIINAAKYNRDRGFWGWVATILAALTLLSLFSHSVTYVVKGPEHVFGEVYVEMFAKENGVAIEKKDSSSQQENSENTQIESWIDSMNVKLPMDQGSGYTLLEISFQEGRQELTYHYKIANLKAEHINDDFKQQMTTWLHSSCSSFKTVFDNGIYAVRYQIEVDDFTDPLIVKVSKSQCDLLEKISY